VLFDNILSNQASVLFYTKLVDNINYQTPMVILLPSLTERIKNALSVFRVSKETIFHYSALFGIFIVALLIRAYPIIAYGYSIRAYDPFVQLLATMMIEKYGPEFLFTTVDYNTWYPWGRSWTALYLGIPLIAATIHKLLLFFGINVDIIVVAAFIAPLFGALTVFVAYGIASEIKSKRAGLFAAFLTAVSPGMIQRTIAGFFDNEAVGIFLVLLTILLFIMASKRGSVPIALLSGIVMGILGWTWGIYRYIYGLLALYVLVLLIIRKLNTNVALTYSISMSLGLGMTAILPRNYGILLSLEGIMVLGVLALVIIEELSLYLSQILAGGRREAYVKLLIGGVIVVSIGLIWLYITGQLAPLASKFASVINPALRNALPTFSSVSENQPAAWGVIFMGAFITVLFAPIGIYYSFEKREFAQVLLALMILTGFYFSASISRYIALGAPLLAVGAGVGIDYLLDPFARVLRGEWIIHRIKPVRVKLGEPTLPRGEAFATYLLIALLLSLSVHNCVISVTSPTVGFGRYDINPAELTIFNYLRMHASPTDVVLSWWDYGYRLRVYSNVTVLADNGTNNSTQMGVVGSMLMLPEEKSIELMKKYNVKYVVVYGVDLYKAIWMIKIADKHAPEFNVTEKEYFDSDEGRYKEPFFHSVLWRLITFKESESQVKSWVTQLGVSELKDRSGEFVPSTLLYFRLLVNAKSGYMMVKLYEVIYRDPLLPPDNPQEKPSVNITGYSMKAEPSRASIAHPLRIEPSLRNVVTHALYITCQLPENRKFDIF